MSYIVDVQNKAKRKQKLKDDRALGKDPASEYKKKRLNKAGVSSASLHRWQ